MSRAAFVVAVPGSGSEYRVGQYIIMVWDKNPLLQVSEPGPA